MAWGADTVWGGVGHEVWEKGHGMQDTGCRTSSVHPQQLSGGGRALGVPTDVEPRHEWVSVGHR